MEMSEREQYLFDLQGFVLVPGFLAAEEVARLNEALDANWNRRLDGGLPAHTSDAVEGGRKPQGMFNGLFQWDRPWCDPFRDLIADPRLYPYLDTLLGRGWRMDMEPVVFHSVKGTRGQVLHGGYPHFHSGHYYHCANGVMRNGMLVVELLLTDQISGKGGFGAIPGSHKSNFLRPREISMMERDSDLVVNPAAKAGDAIIFTEAICHGTLPWEAEHERRVLLLRYTPKFVGFGRGFVDYRFPEWTDELTEAQRAVFEPPYYGGRPLLAADGTVEHAPVDPTEPPARYQSADPTRPAYAITTAPTDAPPARVDRDDEVSTMTKDDWQVIVDNAVENPSFEDDLDPNQVTGWIIGTGDAETDRWAFDDEVASDGRRSLRFEPRQSCVASQLLDVDVDALEGKRVTVEVKVRQDAMAVPSTVMLVAFNPDLPPHPVLQTGVAGMTQMSVLAGRDGRFAPYRGSFVATAPAKTLQVMLVASGNRGTVWFDDVRVSIEA